MIDLTYPNLQEHQKNVEELIFMFAINLMSLTLQEHKLT